MVELDDMELRLIGDENHSPMSKSSLIYSFMPAFDISFAPQKWDVEHL